MSAQAQIWQLYAFLKMHANLSGPPRLHVGSYRCLDITARLHQNVLNVLFQFVWRKLSGTCVLERDRLKVETRYGVRSTLVGEVLAVGGPLCVPCSAALRPPVRWSAPPCPVRPVPGVCCCAGPQVPGSRPFGPAGRAVRGPSVILGPGGPVASFPWPRIPALIVKVLRHSRLSRILRADSMTADSLLSTLSR